MMRCPRHPKYRALRSPRADCGWCRNMRRQVIAKLQEKLDAEMARIKAATDKAWRKYDRHCATDC
jgi:hypothetical protein